jgi:2-dehydro-3-deoxyphosphogluconate aldolase/(4S)-4-hydroxy-2-oxoglutarate aldolase
MNDFQSAFASMPVIGIVRGSGKDSVLPAVNAAFDGGVRCVEITLNTPDALELIAAAAREQRPHTFIGAGTVLTGASCEDAINAGARFIVAPTTLKNVMTVCKRRSIPVFPGALTPSEVYAAWEAGASMVKVFPVSAMGGPSYIKALRGPFKSIPLCACGGVTLENLAAYYTAGANGIAIGGGIFKADWIQSANYSKIREKAQKFVAAIKRIRSR